jgi:hypothetical protein
MHKQPTELHESTDRPPLSLALFGVGVAGVLMSAAGIIISSIPLCILGGLTVLGCAGLFWLGSTLED